MLATPVTVASAERSFSQMKLIKTFSISTMTEERLSDSGIMSIENEIASVIDYDDLVKQFAEANNLCHVVSTLC